MNIQTYAAIKIMAGLAANPTTSIDDPVLNASIALGWTNALMMELQRIPDEQKKGSELAERLKDAGLMQKCPTCQGRGWKLLPAYRKQT